MGNRGYTSVQEAQDDVVVIKRKKALGIFLMILALPVNIAVITISVVLLTTDSPISQKLFAVFVLTLIALSLKLAYRVSLKVFSSNPEFEIHGDHLIVFDDPKYSKIDYADILNCKIYRSSKATFLGIILSNQSKIRGKTNALQRRILKVPEGQKNIIFIKLTFADIKPDKLKKIIETKIKAYQLKV